MLALQALPVATQRRLLRAMADRLGVGFEFKHVQELLLFAQEGKPPQALTLPGGVVARRSHRELQLTCAEDNSTTDYSYRLPVPGQAEVPELGSTICAQLVKLESEPAPQNAQQRRMFGNPGAELSGYNPSLLNRSLLAPELTVRNWRAGDRFFPAHSRSPKKVKELLQAGRLGHEVSAAQRKSWPVIESAGEIVWMRGFPAPEAFAASAGEAVLIEELREE
jgi:tRNA(Ile)-lysidine synthetase-like protein